MILFSLLVSLTAQAIPVDLSQAIEIALKQNGELQAQRVQERQAATDQIRVSGEFGPHLEGLLGVGPITKATGNALSADEDKGTIGRNRYRVAIICVIKNHCVC